MNKSAGLKASLWFGLHRFPRGARSVLLVGRLKDNLGIRIAAHDKSSLAPGGKSIAFSLDAENGFQWKGYCDATVDEVLSGTGSVQTKTMLMEDELKKLLTDPFRRRSIPEGSRAGYFGAHRQHCKEKYRREVGEARKSLVLANFRFKDVRVQCFIYFASLHPSLSFDDRSVTK